MSNYRVTELKQFTAVTLSQQTAELHDAGMKANISSIKSDVKKLDQKIDNTYTYVAEAIDSNEAPRPYGRGICANNKEETEKRFKNHEKHITRLEHRTA